MTTEIPQKSWGTFCDQVMDWHRGSVTIRWSEAGSDPRVIAENMPLQSMVFQKQDEACSDLMMIETGLPDERPLQHQIIEPFRIILRKNAESGRYSELDILAESGETQIIFTPGIDSGLLEKLAA